MLSTAVAALEFASFPVSPDSSSTESDEDEDVATSSRKRRRSDSSSHSSGSSFGEVLFSTTRMKLTEAEKE